MGKRLRGGEVVELRSDLGGGKTTFTRGLVEGAGSPDRVSSPTFTFTKQYDVPPSKRRHLRTIIHADMYRLTDATIVKHELADAMDDPAVTLIAEWAGVVADILPEERVVVAIEAVGELTRKLTIRGPQRFAYLLEEIA